MLIIFTVLNNCWPLITLPNLLFLSYADGYISTGFKKQGAKPVWISKTLILELRKIQLYIPYSINYFTFFSLILLISGVVGYGGILPKPHSTQLLALTLHLCLHLSNHFLHTTKL